ncbi:maleate cis-trans isomerase family protein [Actinoalloteichus spitiensis]|uniref:maleate cis-trans isomerase family protein n=1 Tax=Actinoalloteichus spitiensis TaxID=252394 RepID=UPI000366FF51|nr:hypothetical protein [Actinoalloteichus spitiensis]
MSETTTGPVPGDDANGAAGAPRAPGPTWRGWVAEVVELAALFLAAGAVHLLATGVGHLDFGAGLLVAFGVLLVVTALTHRWWTHRRTHVEGTGSPGPPRSGTAVEERGPGTAAEGAEGRRPAVENDPPVPPAGRLWRIRTRIDDAPGGLALLTAHLALLGANIRSMRVHPEVGGAVDELLVTLPDQVAEAELAEAVTRAGGGGTHLALADVHELADTTTRVLTLTTGLLADRGTLPAVLAQLAATDEPLQAAVAPAGCVPDTVSGTRMCLRAPAGGVLVLTRPGIPFTPVEFARCRALVSLAAALPVPPGTAATVDVGEAEEHSHPGRRAGGPLGRRIAAPERPRPPRPLGPARVALAAGGSTESTVDGPTGRDGAALRDTTTSRERRSEPPPPPTASSAAVGVGVIAPFDFALDRELWRWAPPEVSLYLTRLPYVPMPVTNELAAALTRPSPLRGAVRDVLVPEPRALVFACASASFVHGRAGERELRNTMRAAGAPRAVTSSGALAEALAVLGVRRVAIVTPYVDEVTERLHRFLAEHGVDVVGSTGLGLVRRIWDLTYAEVERAVLDVDGPRAEAVFVSCTNVRTYDLITPMERRLGKPVITANQVSMWAGLRRAGWHAVGAGQSLVELTAG